jgi:TrmH family RNA methyltransferase
MTASKFTTFGDFLPQPAGPQLAVVLVEPRDARNIGAVARAMSNLNVSDLRLVSPGSFDVSMARSVSCWGGGIVDNVRHFASLNEAVADAHEVVGFASDSGQHRTPQRVLEEWVDSIVDDSSRRVALVFGSEEDGLKREHYPLCECLIRIPSSGENRSYNLAQSVLLALYAIRRRSSQFVGAVQAEWPTSSQLEGLTEMVLRVGERVGFLNDNSPAHIESLLVNITRRGRLSTRELKVLTGLFGQIHKQLQKPS